MADETGFPAKTLEDWARLAQTELKGEPVDGLDWITPEGIRVKPLYTPHIALQIYSRSRTHTKFVSALRRNGAKAAFNWKE